MTAFEQAAEKVATVRARFENRLEHIRANKALSDAGKREAIAKAYVDGDSAVAQLREKFDADRANAKTMLERSLFRVPLPPGAGPSDRIAADASFRDGLDRAQATGREDGELKDLMHRSLLTGDTIQARAAMAIALDRGDLEIVNMYVDEHPSSESEIQRYVDLESPETLNSVLGVGNAFAPLNLPGEFHGMFPGEVSALAEGNYSGSAA